MTLFPSHFIQQLLSWKNRIFAMTYTGTVIQEGLRSISAPKAGCTDHVRMFRVLCCIDIYSF